MSVKNRVFVVGVGMTVFYKPGGDKDYPEVCFDISLSACETFSVRLPHALVVELRIMYVCIAFAAFARQLAKEAITQALADAAIPYQAVQQATVGYVYGDSTCGQRALYTVGMTGIPIYNVNNNCSTGSTALFMAKQFIEGGLSDCVLALGFEKMEKGSLGSKYSDRTNPMDQHGE